jgi:hypothetical protein
MPYKPTHANGTFTKFGAPEIEKLYNDRYRIVVRCNVKGVDSKWHYSNVENFWKDFGSLYESPLQVDGADVGWEPATGETYPNMRLIEVAQNYPRTPNDGAPVLEFTYETLTGSYVQDADDKVDHELNGLRRVTRTVIATEDASYAKVVGTDTIDHTGRGYGSETLTLASAEEVPKRQNEGGFTRIQETWVASGTLSETIDNVGSQKSKVIETIGADPATPSGYSLASKQESNFEGLQTNRFTFLKDNVILSESEDKVGSQRAIVQEVFNGTPETPSGYSLAFSRESDVDGISTRRFTFLKPSVLSRNISKRSNGKLIIETVEAFNETPTATTSGAVEIGNDVSNVEGIPTRRFTFAKGEGTIRTSTRPGQIPGTTEKTVISYGTEVVPTGKLISSSQTEEDGYVQYINTAIQGQITGTKQTYKDVVQVEVPGEVQCSTVSVSSGGESGTIAVPKVVPRKRKTIAATVTVEILTTPTNTASVAYDLGEISCSVTSTNVSLTEGPGSTVTIGTNAVVSDTGFVKNFGASARISTYPGCYLTSASSSGTVSYITSSQPVASGNTITRDESTSNRSTECIGTGSTSLTGYLETGVVQRKSRPVLTALNGTTYYEVITWEV